MSVTATRPVVLLRENAPASRSFLRFQGVLPGLRRDRAVLELEFSREHRASTLRGIPAGAIVVIPAQLYNALDLARLRRRSARLILDLDDAIWTRPSDLRLQGAPGHSWTRLSRMALSLIAADLVSCASPYLASQIARTCQRPVRLLPNPLPQSPPLGESIDSELLWIGTKATRPYLEHVLSELSELGAARLLVLSNDPSPITGPSLLQVENLPWSLERQAAALRADTIGLMPSGSDSWSLGKCGYKILQYMAARRPVVSVPQSAGRFLLPLGYPYFASSEPQSWARALRPLLASSELRRQLGERLQSQAQARFSAELVSARWSQVFRELDS